MKKILIALLVACVLFSFVSCGKKAETATTTTTTTVTPAPAATTTVETKAEVKEPEVPAKVEEVKVETAEPVVEAAKPVAETTKSTSGKYKLGMGVVYSDSSTSTQAAYSATVAAVVVDENGVIVDAKIDCAQNKMNGDAIDPEKTYTVACHNYLLQDMGDGYTMFTDNVYILDKVLIDNQVIINYICDFLGGNVGSEYAEPQGRITVI